MTAACCSQDEPDDSLGLVIMDAFSSDAVPAHLITIEALADADRALREDGILAVHVSNRYYDLGPPSRPRWMSWA